MADEDYSSIWEYAMDDDEVTTEQERTIKSIKLQMISDRIYEKPIYAANVSVSSGRTIDTFKALLLWKNSKVAMFTSHEDKLDELIASGLAWKFVYVDDIDDVSAFLKSIEV